MGYDATCVCTLGKESSEGKAQLETDFIQFRSDAIRFKVLLNALDEVKAAGEFLELKFGGQKVRLELGVKVAGRWADKILNPPGRLDKLGVKPGVTVCLEGEFEAMFTREVAGRAAGLAESDLIFLAAREKSALLKAAGLAKRMRRGAALWIVYPKGRADIREIDVINAGRGAGLKDVKVVRFSEKETALKFVAPLDPTTGGERPAAETARGGNQGRP